MNVIAICAHPDDIELNCGGTLLKHKHKGDSIVLIYASDGETTNHKKEIIRSKESAISEAKKASDILGAELYILNYKALDIPFNHRIVAEIESIINKHHADTIYTHGPSHSNQDHQRLNKAVIAATRCTKRVLMWEEGIPHSSCHTAFTPHLYIDITDQMPKKIELIEAHETQINKYGQDLIEAVTARARYRGYQIRTKYAECFEVSRLIDDGFTNR